VTRIYRPRARSSYSSFKRLGVGPSLGNRSRRPTLAAIFSFNVFHPLSVGRPRFPKLGGVRRRLTMTISTCKLQRVTLRDRIAKPTVREMPRERHRDRSPIPWQHVDRFSRNYYRDKARGIILLRGREPNSPFVRRGRTIAK